ncbi:uncharacterized protein UTRI_02745_B [Ustilago trichophora]|uniref:Uncharacterized protein n=1 Tax=Ustilago trichophora TaxID=86804 RepID=A0A5C3E4Y0_9BASI|nr:uncharacterized protein UTRI_02745_B [Ustilago trichophora]
MSRSSTVATAASNSAAGRRGSSTSRRPSSSSSSATVEAQLGSGAVSNVISSPRSRPTSVVRSPPNLTTSNNASSRTRPTSQPARTQPFTTNTTALPSSRKTSTNVATTTTSRTSTPTSSAASSRRSSLVGLDSATCRYSLHTGSVSRFPTPVPNGASGGGSGAREILASSPHLGFKGAGKKEDMSTVDPSRASVSSTTPSYSSGKSCSRVSSRYVVEEEAPQRRPVYLALPNDPAVGGVWSSTQSTLAAQPSIRDSDKSGKSGGQGVGKKKGGGEGGEPRRDSKIMTSFPFPHPVTPRRGGGIGGGSGSGSNGGVSRGWNATWQRLLTAIFAGPYERRLNREEMEDDRITQSIIANIAQRNSSQPHTFTTSSATNSTKYGTLAIPRSSIMPTKPSASSPGSSSEEDAQDPNDPYGYRRLAGPHLLPSYTTDLVARRRERRRARSRARFQCMALWTIWTVSVILVLIVAVLVFSFMFPDKLEIPNHGDDDEEGEGLVGVLIQMVGKVGVLARLQKSSLLVMDTFAFGG